MLALNYLRILRYRNVRPGSLLRFDGRFNILLGENGTGKTTLLDLLSAILRLDFSELAADDLDLEYQLSWSQGTMRVDLINLKRETARAKLPPLAGENIKARFGHLVAEQTHFWSIRVAIHLSSQPEVITLSPEQTSSPFSGFSLWPVLHELLLDKDPGPDLGGVSAAFRFDESLDLFRVLTDSTARKASGISTSIGWVEDIPFLHPKRFLPESLIEALSQSRGDHQSEDDLIIKSDQLDFLKDLIAALSFHAAEVRAEPVENEPAKRRLTYGNFRFRFTRRDGSLVTHDRLSYGQKRMLTFFYYLAANPSVVIADELVNGLHHRWIDACLHALGARQAFLTSQNPLLLDYLEFSSAEQAQSSFLTCRCVMQEGREQMTWSNMSKEDAEVFFAAYEVGLEHVGEILQTRGLW